MHTHTHTRNESHTHTQHKTRQWEGELQAMREVPLETRPERMNSLFP